MFKAPAKVPECWDQMPVETPRLNFQALLAEAQYKSSLRTLPPPPELRFPLKICHKDDKDTQNMVLRTLQAPDKAEVPVADPRNKDPLDLVWDTD